jgi:anaphase-promoting complex subunit 10 (APC10)
MRKSIVSPSAVAATPISDLWRDLERIARVEISSEDPQFPIEHALGKKVTTGWRAAGTGPQLIRLHFDEPLNIKRLQLHFVDKAAERSQEFAVYAGSGPELKEVVRQQWSFSPHGSTEEMEDYTVNLSGITTLEVRIDPDRSHDPKQSQHYASLQSLKLA